MEAILYHGSSRKLNRFHGFSTSKKKGRMQYGTGLYATTSYNWASMYGKSINTLIVDLDESKSSRNVMVSVNDCAKFVYENCPKKFYEFFMKEFASTKETCTAYQFQYFFLVYRMDKFHLMAQAMNDWLVAQGVQYTPDHELKGDLVLIHDFKMIREMGNAKDYGYQDSPRLDGKYFLKY